MMLREIYKAKKKIEGWARRTPMEFSSPLSKVAECEAWLKLENYQVTGSFKIRGATNKILSLTQEERGKGVITASSGNHAQGLGYVAKRMDVESVVVVPENTPEIKIDAIRNYGVRLLVHGEEYIEAEEKAHKLADSDGMTYISPYNDIDLIAGQATVGLEMMEDQPRLDTVLVPVGGGGLISGVATVFKEASDSEIIGIQSDASPVMYESLKRGKIVDIELSDSYAEGLHGGIEKGSITFDMCQELVDDFIIVEEDSILDAIAFALKEHHMIIEGAAAVGIAGFLKEKNRLHGRKVGILISGGNLDQNILKKIVNT
jgi:threonine dehydratase